ncbi:MAG: hypothetical protein OXK17_08450 [Thaumarchaeota archaeon]|nr:hypothetical protein [Nitrososphaerota archaeon]
MSPHTRDMAHTPLPRDHPLGKRYLLLCPDGSWRAFDLDFPVATYGAHNASMEHAAAHEDADPEGRYTMYRMIRPPAGSAGQAVELEPAWERSAGGLAREAHTLGVLAA